MPFSVMKIMLILCSNKRIIEDSVELKFIRIFSERNVCSFSGTWLWRILILQPMWFFFHIVIWPLTFLIPSPFLSSCLISYLESRPWNSFLKDLPDFCWPSSNSFAKLPLKPKFLQDQFDYAVCPSFHTLLALIIYCLMVKHFRIGIKVFYDPVTDYFFILTSHQNMPLPSSSMHIYSTSTNNSNIRYYLNFVDYVMSFNISKPLYLVCSLPRIPNSFSRFFCLVNS